MKRRIFPVFGVAVWGTIVVMVAVFCGTLRIPSSLMAENPPLSPVEVTLSFGGSERLPAFGSVTGVWFYADSDIPQKMKSQAILLGHNDAGLSHSPNWRCVIDLFPGESVILRLQWEGDRTVSCRVQEDSKSEKSASVDSPFLSTSSTQISTNFALSANSVYVEPTDSVRGEKFWTIHHDGSEETGSESVTVFLDQFVATDANGVSTPLRMTPRRRPQSLDPVESFPDLTPALQAELIEWDWRMQDGIDTPREPRSFAAAIEKRLPQIRGMLADVLENASTENESETFLADEKRLDALTAEWETVRQSADSESDGRAEAVWRAIHHLRRDIALANRLFPREKIVFAKHVPSVMSHQLTQVYGYAARPGGGLFTLEKPGESFTTEEIMLGLPLGNFSHPAVSYDGEKIVFAYCETPTTPTAWRAPDVMDRYYQLYSARPDGTDVRKLTEGAFDHFSPVFLPGGGMICCSTHRGGFHRCGSGPCRVYTLTKMNDDGSELAPISYHETQEWNPTVAADGRIVYTRWDYVDRDAVYYQQLWSCRPDGTDVRIYYGNNTFSPCGLWEAKAIPNSTKIMAVAAPHHGMSAGSVVMIDTTLGVDGPEPITRLTPEVLFPESEEPLPLIPQLPTLFDFDTPAEHFWHATRPAERLTETEENRRWPGHCFKSPWPLSEKYFLASYSFDKLLGEAGPNIPNQFGLYFCDAFGTRELLFRDPNLSSVWGIPLAAQDAPPRLVSSLPDELIDENGVPKPGQFYLQNVYESWPWKFPDGTHIAALRVVQVLPKTTPNANDPMVGAASASPGKQVLGTVPVASDGSALFEVPSKIPFLLQALDDSGRMVMGMRSLIYAQPGEMASCTGCHEDRLATPPPVTTLASRQGVPSAIRPGPDGSLPLSYPLLVQPVLDAKCVLCHNDEKAEGGVNLTGTPEGDYTKSYNALVTRVRFSAWGMPEGNFEPRTEPLRFGTPASSLVELLDAGHYDVTLSDGEWERLCTWIDGANGLFYGTFNRTDQAIQRSGGRISGPDLE